MFYWLRHTCNYLMDILVNKIHTCKHTQPHHFALLLPSQKGGHLHFCQAVQVGHRSGCDNWREFTESTFDKHDNALTALIAPWLMTDIPVACLIQNANAAQWENDPNMTWSWMQEETNKASAGRVLSAPGSKVLSCKSLQRMMREMLRDDWKWMQANPSHLWQHVDI